MFAQLFARLWKPGDDEHLKAKQDVTADENGALRTRIVGSNGEPITSTDGALNISATLDVGDISISEVGITANGATVSDDNPLPVKNGPLEAAVAGQNDPDPGNRSLVGLLDAAGAVVKAWEQGSNGGGLVELVGSLPAGSALLGLMKLADTGGSAINPAKEDGNLATLVARTPVVGAALAAASRPVALATDQLSTLATQTTLAALSAKFAALGQQAQSSAITVTSPSDFANRQIAAKPNGSLFTTSGGSALKFGTAPVQLGSGAGRFGYLRVSNSHATVSAVVYLTDSASAPVAGQPASWLFRGNLSANGGNQVLDITGGFSFTNGLWLWCNTALIAYGGNYAFLAGDTCEYTLNS